MDHDDFWNRVDIGDEDECWEWQAKSRSAAGYGMVRTPKGVTTASRVAYELSIGSIPDAHYVCHRCDNPPCVNPAHLFAGTSQENALDMWAKGRARTDPHHGEAHKLAKLTDEAVRQIRARAGSVSQRALAAEFQVSQRTIWKVIKGHGWVHVTEGSEWPS